MSMIKAQEYFAPLRSRHISLQQWERGLLFESWGRRGGRADRRKSGDLNRYMAASDPEDQEIRPVKKVIARSVSLSAVDGIDIGSEVKANLFRRGLSFSRSLSPTGEIIPEDYDHHGPARIDISRKSNAGHPAMFRSKTSTGLLYSRSSESSRETCIGSEMSESSSSRSEYSSDLDSDRPARTDRDLECRPWPKKFFSGGLLFSKDKKFFSGALSFTKSFGRSSDCLQSWDSTKNFQDHKDGAATRSPDINQDSRVKRNFLARMLSFSRSPDPRGQTSAEVRETSKSFKEMEIQSKKLFRRDLSFSQSLDPRGELSSYDHDISSSDTEIQESKKVFRRDLSFSGSLDPKGEISSEVCDINTSFPATEIQESENVFVSGNDLSYSKSLDPNINGDILSDASESPGNSGSSIANSELKAPQLSWSKKLISRSGLFFSRSLDSRRYDKGPSKIRSTGTHSESFSPELRPRKLLGRGFSLSFSRFLDPKGNSSPVDFVTSNPPEKADKEFRFKNFFTRGFFSLNLRTADTKDPGAANCGTSGSSDNGTTLLSKKFFSKDWSWSRSANRNTSPSSAQAPMAVITSTKSSATVNNPSFNYRSSKSSYFSSLRNSRALKYWWSKRSQSSVVTSKSILAHEQNSRLVLLEKVPAAGDQGSDDLTVYVGERGGSLTKYVLAKQILQHHLFQVLLKCSQDELGSDHDYNSGVPIICDPALFLQVARVVGANFAAEAQLCR